jgi:predicted transcriptional regulator
LPTPTWVQNYIGIYGKYGGGLSLMGMNARDIGIFVFLFTQRWFEKKITFSTPEIVKTLNPISSMLPKEFRTTYSEKSVGNSLKKLATLGFVTKCKNNEKNSNGGRPADVLYETVHLSAIRENIIKTLDSYKQGILHTILPFEAMEEGITLKEGITEE